MYMPDAHIHYIYAGMCYDMGFEYKACRNYTMLIHELLFKNTVEVKLVIFSEVMSYMHVIAVIM